MVTEQEFKTLLLVIKTDTTKVIKSNMLDKDEYICWREDAQIFCYEDNCAIGSTSLEVYHLLFEILGWAKDADCKFWITTRKQ